MKRLLMIVAFLLAPPAVAVSAQSDRPGLPPVPLPDGPLVYETAEHPHVRVVVVTRGLSHPWAIAFLPDGRMLVTERAGALREIRDGHLLPRPIPGVPEVFTEGLAGLMDITLHPDMRKTGFSTSHTQSRGTMAPESHLLAGVLATRD